MTLEGTGRPTPRRWISVLVLLAIIATATAIRIKGAGWSIRMEHKQSPEVPRTDEGTFLGHFKNYPKHENVYVPQAAVHALLIEPIAKRIARAFDPMHQTTDYFIYQVGRTASMLASLAFLVLVFIGGRAFGLRTLFQRSLATGLLAFSPMVSVYGHLFLADSLSLLWIYLSFWAFIRYTERGEDRFAVLFALAAGFAGSTKFATSYCIIPGLAMLLVARRPFVTAVMMALVSVGAFWIGTGFTYDMGKLKWAHEFLTNIRSGNRIAIEVGVNIGNQAVFFLSALGIPAALLTCGAVLHASWRSLRSVPGLARLARRVSRSWWRLQQPSNLRRRLADWMSRSGLTIVNLSLAAQFLLFATSGIGGFFARHVLPFVPALIFAAVRFVSRVPAARHRWVQVTTVIALLGYQIVFCLDGERAYFNDPRLRARDWVKNGRPARLLAFNGPYSYTVTEGLPRTSGVKFLGPSPVPRIPGDHLLITQQASYGRYLLADTCDKIQHCWGGDSARIFFTDLVRGRSKAYRLVKAFVPGYFMPEHRLLERVVPSHPYPEVGKILVFRKLPSKPAPRPARPQPVRRIARPIKRAR